MKHISILAIALLLIACSKEISMKEQDYEKKLVINGLLCPDSLVTVRIGQTYSILTGEGSVVANATVELYANGRFAELLQHQGNGIYRSTGIYPMPDSAYTIRAELEGYPEASATDTVPQKTYIIYGSHTIGNTYDEYGDPHHDYEIIIDDIPGSNYYELFFAEQFYSNFFPGLGYLADSGYYALNYQIGISIADPVLRADSELDYWVHTYIFRDILFDGRQYRMVNKFESSSSQGKSKQAFLPTSNEEYAVLRTTSRTYFNYRKYWIRHSNNQQTAGPIEEPMFMTIMGDPVPMFNNVEGGYGIFAAYNQTIYKLKELESYE